MNEAQILEEFENAQGILSGHFILSSGLHSDTYIQCARALMDPKRSARLCQALANKVRNSITEQIDIVVAPAMGGVIVGYEMARQLDVQSIFCERVNGQFQLRRGFTLTKGANVLVVEDVVTTGKSSIETFECIKSYGANIVAEASLINRSGKTNPLGNIPLISLISLDIKSYEPDQLPANLQSIKVEKPGSRFLKS